MRFGSQGRSRAGMKLLETYILRRVGQMFLVALLPVLAIIWTTQVLQRINLVTDSGQSIGSFAKLATLSFRLSFRSSCPSHSSSE
jgi:lipopolysaccharide export system permease protein